MPCCLSVHDWMLVQIASQCCQKCCDWELFFFLPVPFIRILLLCVSFVSLKVCWYRVSWVDELGRLTKGTPAVKRFVLHDWDTEILKCICQREKSSTGSASWICCIYSVTEWMMCQLIDASALSTFQGLSFATSHNAWKESSHRCQPDCWHCRWDILSLLPRVNFWSLWSHVWCDVCVWRLCRHISCRTLVSQNLPSTKETSVNGMKRFKRCCFINIPDGPGCITFPQSVQVKLIRRQCLHSCITEVLNIPASRSLPLQYECKMADYWSDQKCNTLKLHWRLSLLGGL